MKPSTGILVTLKNTTASMVGGVPANASKVVFASPSWGWADRQGILAGLSAGSLVGLDLSGSPLPYTAAGAAVLDLATAADGLAADLAGASALPRCALKVAWNMDAASRVVASVRADMVNTGLATCGVTAAGVLGKLQGVVTLVGLGMFSEAAATLAGVTPDGYLTTTRLALYQAMLNAADALALP